MRRNAALNAQNSQGFSALHFCYRFGHIKLAEYLISKGGDPGLRDYNGRQCHEMNGGSPMSPMHKGLHLEASPSLSLPASS